MLKSNDKTPFIQKPVNSFFSFTETSYVKNQPIFSIHRVKKVDKCKMMKKTYDTESFEKNCEKSTSFVKHDNPGAARQGNFINYYQFNPPSERLSLLFPEKLDGKLEEMVDGEPLVCLDIGCNSGVSKFLI